MKLGERQRSITGAVLDNWSDRYKIITYPATALATSGWPSLMHASATGQGHIWPAGSICRNNEKRALNEADDGQWVAWLGFSSIIIRLAASWNEMMPPRSTYIATLPHQKSESRVCVRVCHLLIFSLREWCRARQSWVVLARDSFCTVGAMLARTRWVYVSNFKSDGSIIKSYYAMVLCFVSKLNVTYRASLFCLFS